MTVEQTENGQMSLTEIVPFLEEGASAGLRMADRDVTPSGTAPVHTTHFPTAHAEDVNVMAARFVGGGGAERQA